MKLILSYVALTIPFLFAGGVLGWVFMLRAKSIGRLYAIDLTCSSGAVMAFLLLLWPLGGDLFVWMCTGLALIGFLTFSQKVVKPGLRMIVALICVLCALLINKHLIGEKPEAYKTLARAFLPGDIAPVGIGKWLGVYYKGCLDKGLLCAGWRREFLRKGLHGRDFSRLN